MKEKAKKILAWTYIIFISIWVFFLILDYGLINLIPETEGDLLIIAFVGCLLSLSIKTLKENKK